MAGVSSRCKADPKSGSTLVGIANPIGASATTGSNAWRARRDGGCRVGAGVRHAWPRTTLALAPGGGECCLLGCSAGGAAADLAEIAGALANTRSCHGVPTPQDRFCLERNGSGAGEGGLHVSGHQNLQGREWVFCGQRTHSPSPQRPVASFALQTWRLQVFAARALSPGWRACSLPAFKHPAIQPQGPQRVQHRLAGSQRVGRRRRDRGRQHILVVQMLCAGCVPAASRHGTCAVHLPARAHAADTPRPLPAWE